MVFTAWLRVDPFSTVCSMTSLPAKKSLVPLLPPGTHIARQKIAVFGEIDAPFNRECLATSGGRRLVTGAGKETQAPVDRVEARRTQ